MKTGNNKQIGNNMSKMKSTTILSAFILSAALMGCNNNSDPVPDPAEPQAAGSAQMSEPQTPSGQDMAGAETPTSEPNEPSDAGGDPVLTKDGYGSYIIGDTLEETGLVLGTNVPEQGDCLYATNGEDRDVLFMLIDNKLARIDVTEGDLAMPTGIGLGSSGDDVKSAYAGQLVVTPGKYEPTLEDYTVTFSDTRGAVFQVQDGEVQRYRVGQFPQVTWVEGCL